MAFSASPLLHSILAYNVLIPVALVLLILPVTYISTAVRYQRGLQQLKSGKDKIALPVKIPYSIPVLGSALKFLQRKPGSFWTYLFKWHPYSTGACTLKLGGQNMHFLYDTQAIQALFKVRELHRHSFNVDVAVKAFGVEESEVKRYHELGDNEPLSKKYDGRTLIAQQEWLMTNTLLRADRVNELTNLFLNTLHNQLSSDLSGDEKHVETGLYAWLRTRLFNATVDTFFGTTCRQDYPDLEQDFFDFEGKLLACLFGIPRWMSPHVYNVRDRLTKNLIRWHERNLERNKGHVVDPDGDIEWEPVQGSRANRARQVYYADRNLKLRTKALMDLGFLFGVASNAMPAAGWILMHILDPNGDKTVYPRITSEVRASRHSDGSIDINLLLSQPLLNSMLHEVLRLYSDFLVAREIEKDLVLPLSGGNANRSVLFPKKSMLMAPAWLEHRNTDLWPGPDPNTFYADRFLSTDRDTGKQTFSLSGTAGKLFPFGGGKTMCPGRVFAKQEILVSVATVLAEFEFEVLGFVGADGVTEVERFPSIADAYPGTAVFPMLGDVRVRIRRREGMSE